MGKVTLTTPKTARDALQWLVDHPHHYGCVVEGGLRLEGEDAAIVIPSGMVDPKLKRVSNFEKTGRMFEPTKAGRALLADQGGERG